MKIAIVTALLVFALTAQTGPQPKTGKRLLKQMPSVRWDLTSAGTLDIDCDGQEDSFLWGSQRVTRTHYINNKPERHTRREIVFGFERASATKSQAVSIPFRKDTGYYGFCSNPKVIEVRPLSCEWEGGVLPGCTEAKRCQALWVEDGECGEFLIYWDSSTRRPSWVRPSNNTTQTPSR